MFADSQSRCPGPRPRFDTSNQISTFWDRLYIDACFAAWKKWQGKEQPGFWIDMDMIPFGQLQLMSPPDGDPTKSKLDRAEIALAGKGVRRWSLLTQPQMRTFITMRAMAASPLMMGGDLPSLDDYSLRLITDPDMLTCNQNGIMGHCISERDGLAIWRTPHRNHPEHGWIGIFNRSSDSTSFRLRAADLQLDGDAALYDVWGSREIAFGEEVTLQPHDALFLRVQ